MIDIYDYLCFDGLERSWTQKVEYILKNASQREEYRKLVSAKEKSDFFLNHFVMNDLAARQLAATFSKGETVCNEFIQRVEYIMDVLDNRTSVETIEPEYNVAEKIDI